MSYIRKWNKSFVFSSVTTATFSRFCSIVQVRLCTFFVPLFNYIHKLSRMVLSCSFDCFIRNSIYPIIQFLFSITPNIVSVFFSLTFDTTTFAVFSVKVTLVEQKANPLLPRLDARLHRVYFMFKLTNECQNL